MNAERMELPAFTIERLDDSPMRCELPTCAGYVGARLPATHRVKLPDDVEVLICDQHALGIVALGEYLKNGPLTLEPA
jgi:hypothetical protein